MAGLLIYIGRHSWIRYQRGRSGRMVAVPEQSVGSRPA